jgi:hypothetical protein
LKETTAIDEVQKGKEKLRVNTPSPKHLDKIKKFYEELQPSSDDSKLAAFLKLNVRGICDPESFLTELSEESNFKINFVDEINKDDETKRSLLQLSSLPVAVCIGEGTTMQAARLKASECALRYLQIILKPENDGKEDV